jgi:hypothetical protein
MDYYSRVIVICTSAHPADGLADQLAAFTDMPNGNQRTFCRSRRRARA